jgi:polar amino acid transport system substrate-binding protein
MRGTLRRAGVAGAILLLVGVSGCGGSGGTASSGRSGTPGAGAVQAEPALAAAAASCTPGATASYQPPAGILTTWPSGSLMQTIKDRGYLVVGVSGDTRLLGARNMLQGGALEGFDIDIAKQVAKALLGDPEKVRFKVITAGQRFTFADAGAGTAAAPLKGVDLVARAVTMTCDRWSNPDPAKHAAFSSVYLMAQQKLLVGRDSAVKSVADLQSAKAKVCAPTGSTSLANLAKYPGIQPVSVEIHSDCLALWQEGKVDAITGDDAILAGFQAQDPHAKIVGEPLEAEPYGLAVAASHKEFAQYLNAVLEQVRSDGTWAKLYDTWLAGPLGATSGPPVATYGR